MLAPPKTSRLVVARAISTRAAQANHLPAPVRCPAHDNNIRAPLIERLGGPEAVKAAVDVFYTKVLADERVNDYFTNTDMEKQRAHQAAFMTYAFGGAAAYKGKGMAEAHRHLVPHLNETHFNAIAENFVATLQELGVPQEDIDAAVAVVASTKDQVLAD